MRFRFYYLFIIFIFTGITNQLFAGDYTDRKYHFKITVPDSWKSNIYTEGSDKVYDFLSPDENVFIQIRAFSLIKGLSLDLLTRVYEKDYLPPNSRRLSFDKKILPGGSIKGLGSYISHINKQEVIIGVYYILHRGSGYVLTVIIPSSLFNEKQDETQKILHSFDLEGLPSSRKTSGKTENQHVSANAFAEKQKTEQQYPESPDNLFSGTQSGGTQGVSKNRKVSAVKTKTAQTENSFYGISEQNTFWADVPLSHGSWEKLPFASTLLINHLHSNRMSYQVYASGYRVNSSFAPHITHFDGESKSNERESFNYKSGNQNYAADHANDIFSFSTRHYWLCGPKGMIMFSNLNGYRWKKQETPVNQELLSISFADENRGCAAGNDGIVLVTRNGGQLWKKAISPAGYRLVKVIMVNPHTGYILVSRTSPGVGVVLKTTDGGNRWQVVHYNTGFRTPLHMAGMSFTDENNGWICGKFGLVFHTHDGGKTWKTQSSAREAAQNRNLRAIYMINNREGWAAGDKGTLIYTKNGGKTWERRNLNTTANLVALEFNGPYLGWVASSRSVFQYYDKRFDSYRGAFVKRFPLY
ncbi:hypothetical protein LA303_00585 [Candidatus Sulfidibacterium hydrothermale]|uniref:WD40/YVTN/BNR-like repeat-containing protein n=1 Tax=Candidatus Sulfidibacterium hydrothermale TaxID=2875962 RepID=UPI001F0A133E|nr:YCF48-related protein [Candidatus Sulfidibacterium hydrothermale]UBM62492.1 hypothetical protein LA303_00585 [Candidatus Sulfidibacterium hydrothermale]